MGVFVRKVRSKIHTGMFVVISLLISKGEYISRDMRKSGTLCMPRVPR